jgi:hypothetical protein
MYRVFAGSGQLKGLLLGELPSPVAMETVAKSFGIEPQEKTKDKHKNKPDS